MLKYRYILNPWQIFDLKFKKIGIFVKHDSAPAIKTAVEISNFLLSKMLVVYVEPHISNLVSQCAVFETDLLNYKAIDLAIVIGGDGTFLNVARVLADFDTPMVGINYGRLGFVTDINSDAALLQLALILEGGYKKEQRKMIQVNWKIGEVQYSQVAVNDIVLHAKNISRMIEYDIYVDDCFVTRQRADGVIAASPTGSTAYALSAGGPLLAPWLNLISIVPLSPHTMSNRALVVSDNNTISIKCTDYGPKASLSCDGQKHYSLVEKTSIEITGAKKYLTILHPLNYDYFATLRNKLGWASLDQTVHR